MDQFPSNQDATLNQYQSMPYNEYERQYYPLQQQLPLPPLPPPSATTFPSNPLFSAQYQYQNSYSHRHPHNQTYTQEMVPQKPAPQEMSWKSQDLSQMNLLSQPFQPFVYHQAMGLSQLAVQDDMDQGYSNLRGVANSVPEYTEQSPRKRQRVDESNGPTARSILPTIVPPEPQQTGPDATSECCSSCSSGSLCSESDCDERNVVVACTSPECEQPVCTSPECEQPLYTEPCIRDGALSRRCSVTEDRLPSDNMFPSWGDRFPSEKMFPSWGNPAWAPAMSQADAPMQASNFQPFAPGLQNNQTPQDISPSPVPTTPSLALNMDTPYTDSTVLQTPGLPTQQATNDMSGSSLSGTGMRFGDGLENFNCSWLNCGQPMHDQYEWHKHFHQEHIDPQFTFNCPMPSGSCQTPLNSNPLDHLQMNHGFSFDENMYANGLPCPAPGCLTDEMYCDPSMLHNHMDQMHAVPIQGQLHCQVDSCNTSYQDQNLFFSHLNQHHNLPIPMTPIEEIDLSSIQAQLPTQAQGQAEVEEETEEEVTAASNTGGSEAVNHLSCKWATNNHPCGQVFTSEDDLQTHVKEAHLAVLNKDSGYFCKWQGCGRKLKMGDKEGFSQRGKLERHMASHTGFKECTCDFPGCGKTFAAQQSLKQHYRLHTGEKPWKCKYCPKSFPQQSACTVHERIHTHEKPLVCSICGKSFSESSNLAKHRKTHGEKGHYKCPEPECLKTFHRLDQLKRHGEMHERRKKKAAGGGIGDGNGEDGRSEFTESVATESVVGGEEN